MRLTYTFSQKLMKIFFSAVLLQLFFISLFAGEGHYTSFEVMAMLEHAAAGGVCALGSGLFLEYVIRSEF